MALVRSEDRVFQPEHKLRHLRFFESIASQDEHDPKWRVTTAGFLVLRLVDSWIEDGPRVVTNDEWGLRAVRSAVEEIVAHSKIAAVLSSIVDALETSSLVDMGVLAPRLMAYGQLLEYDAEWSLASDVYETIIAHAHPVQEADVAAHAHLRVGFCHRQMGDLLASVRSYQTAGEIAHASNDIVGVLRARIGEAKAAVARGNMPDARTILDDTITQAKRHQLGEVTSMALHDRAMVAHLSGDYELAVSLAYEALEATQAPRERDRILGDIATSFYKLGLRNSARDAYLILAATAQEQYARWFATLNLMEIAADDGEQMLFEQFRRSIQPAALPPRLQVQYWMTAGLAYGNFGRREDATKYLECALEVAEEYSLNQLAFEVESALAGDREPPRIQPRVEFVTEDINEAVDEVQRSLRGRREEINA